MNGGRFIITAVGVLAGLAAFVAAWMTILEAQRQARSDAKTAKAQCWIMLRGVFANYDDIHVNFRPGGAWHRSQTLPASTGDSARTELYMGLFEYCNRLLDQDRVDAEAFVDSCRYRLTNIVTNRWVLEKKLIDSNCESLMSHR